MVRAWNSQMQPRGLAASLPHRRKHAATSQPAKLKAAQGPQQPGPVDHHSSN